MAAILGPLMIDVREVAAMCGVSPATIKRMTAAGKFPAPTKLRRRTLWNRGAVEAWIAKETAALAV